MRLTISIAGLSLILTAFYKIVKLYFDYLKSKNRKDFSATEKQEIATLIRKASGAVKKILLDINIEKALNASTKYNQVPTAENKIKALNLVNKVRYNTDGEVGESFDNLEKAIHNVKESGDWSEFNAAFSGVIIAHRKDKCKKQLETTESDSVKE